MLKPAPRQKKYEKLKNKIPDRWLLGSEIKQIIRENTDFEEGQIRSMMDYIREKFERKERELGRETMYKKGDKEGENDD